MREIKFRIWNPVKKSMSPEGTFKKFILELGNLKIDIDKESWIILQYTGLRDTNGKLIYEGDIVKRDKGTYLSHSNRIVEWQKYGWNIRRGDVWEIIGNIYENPDLIKK